MSFKYLDVERFGNVFLITLHKAPENRLTVEFCQEIIRAFHNIQRELGPDSEGAVVTRGAGDKFFCTGLDLNETESNPFANADGFYPMLHTILDFPYPTVALVNGHTFGGACLLAFAHDYRVMNSERGYFSMVPVNLGLHFNGIGAMPKAKLHPLVARKLLLEAHKYTGKEALQDGVVDLIATPDKMQEEALALAAKWAPKAKMGVYGVLRSEFVGEALTKLKQLSYVHASSGMKPKAKV